MLLCHMLCEISTGVAPISPETVQRYVDVSDTFWIISFSIPSRGCNSTIGSQSFSLFSSCRSVLFIKFTHCLNDPRYIFLCHVVIQRQSKEMRADFIGNRHVSTCAPQPFPCGRRMEWHIMNYCLYTCAPKMLHQSVSFFR